jgi:hypothetical protein
MLHINFDPSPILPYVHVFSLVVKGPAAKATNAPQPGGLLCNPVIKLKKNMIFFSLLQATEHRWNEAYSTKPKYSGETSPSVTLSTTNPIWTKPGSNPHLSGGRPVTNRLSYGTTITFMCYYAQEHRETFLLLPTLCLRIAALILKQWALLFSEHPSGAVKYTHLFQ